MVILISLQKIGEFVYYLYFSHNSLSMSILINLLCGSTFAFGYRVIPNVRRLCLYSVRKTAIARLRVFYGRETMGGWRMVTVLFVDAARSLISARPRFVDRRAETKRGWGEITKTAGRRRRLAKIYRVTRKTGVKKQTRNEPRYHFYY